jgi:hypothetical protein
MQRFVGSLGAVWGALGVFGLLLFAIYRLTFRALEAYDGGLSAVQWSIAVVVCVFMAYTEGYRGFQTRFSPRTAARIRYLRDRPRVVHTLLAPLFAMGYFHATRRTKIVAWSLTLGIATLVILIHRLDQPWRGIIDAGVVIGLGWGMVSLAFCTYNALTRDSYAPSPEVPEPPSDPLSVAGDARPRNVSG